MKTKLLNYAIILTSFILMTACESCKTTPDTSDTTPPTIDWTIINKSDNNAETKINGSGSATFNLGDQLTITACVNDSGGVKEISSSSALGYRCVSGDVAQQVGPGLAAVETTPLGLDSNGKAWSRYCKIFSVDLTINCSSGYTFDGGTYTFNVSGKNYADLSASATLTLTIDP